MRGQARCDMHGGKSPQALRAAERRMERELISSYELTIERLLERLSTDNVETAAAIASVPEQIRGYGHIKAASVTTATQDEARLLAVFEAGKQALVRAA